MNTQRLATSDPDTDPDTDRLLAEPGSGHSDGPWSSSQRQAPDACGQVPDPYELAERRVQARIGLGVHWLVYVVVNLGMVVAAGGTDGAIWRLAGWGLGLLLHTAAVMIDVEGLRERLIERELGRGPFRS